MILSGCANSPPILNNPTNQFDDLLDSDNFLVIAHRGASKFAPEHTISPY